MRARPGAALVSALLGLLLLEAAIAGLLFACTQEALIARAHAERLRLRLAAESAVEAAIATWPSDSVRALLPGGTHRPVAASGTLTGGARFDAEIERLRGGWFVVRGFGGLGATPGAARAAALVAALETAPLWREFSAPLVTGGPAEVAASGIVDGQRADAVPAPWTTAECPARRLLEPLATLGSLDRPALLSAPGAAHVVTPGAVLTGTPAIAHDSLLASASAFATLGELDFDAAAALADRVEAGTLSLAPVANGGACAVAAAANWGAPLDSSHPCATYLPVVYAPGDLELGGGAGQAILLVRGNLRVRSGVHFTGAILAAGVVTVDGATVLGSIRAAGGARVLGSALVTYNACALWRAFTLAGPFRRPVRRAPRWWLPLG